MEKVKNWCEVQVILDVQEEDVAGICALLGMSPEVMEYEADGEISELTLATVVDVHFSGTRASLLEMLKRADDLVSDYREALRRIEAEYRVCGYTVVRVDFLYDPAASQEKPFTYYCYGTDEFLLWTDAWHCSAADLWDGVSWDTRQAWQRACDAPALRALSAQELMDYLEDDER